MPKHKPVVATVVLNFDPTQPRPTKKAIKLFLETWIGGGDPNSLDPKSHAEFKSVSQAFIGTAVRVRAVDID